MTYGTTLPKTAAQRAQEPIMGVTSASSIVYREMIPVWQQPNLLSLVEQRYVLRRRNEVIGFI